MAHSYPRPYATAARPHPTEREQRATHRPTPRPQTQRTRRGQSGERPTGSSAASPRSERDHGGVTVAAHADPRDQRRRRGVPRDPGPGRGPRRRRPRPARGRPERRTQRQRRRDRATAPIGADGVHRRGVAPSPGGDGPRHRRDTRRRGLRRAPRRLRSGPRRRRLGDQPGREHGAPRPALGNRRRRPHRRRARRPCPRGQHRAGETYEWSTAATIGAAAIPWVAAPDANGPRVLNLNVPNVALADVAGVRDAHLATFAEAWTAETRPGEVVLRYEGHAGEPGSSTDLTLVKAGYATVTPLNGIERAGDSGGSSDAAALIDAALTSIGSKP